ncbi:PIN domain-containing protein [Candidatus Gracilibacteria bacterium]|nr:PIN domain-containing protein [Candidatus Gracilibacteria bacterium]
MTNDTTTAAFIDTNVWLYAFIIGQDPVKRQQAVELIRTTETIFISTQVINEVCTNLLRKENKSEQELRDVIDDFYELYTVLEIDRAQLLHASFLREKYALSYWDGVIIASAVRSTAPIVYSEDMHDGLVVEQRVRIVNPFR